MNAAKKLSLKLAALTLCIAFQSPAIAADTMAPDTMQDDSDTAPIATTPGETSESAVRPQDTSSVPIYSGGIGDDDMDYIRQVQHKFDTKILFTATEGEYISDVHVTISDSHGDALVDTMIQGPVLLVDLPSGSYKVTSTLGDSTLAQRITVVRHSLKTFQVRFHTPANPGK